VVYPNSVNLLSAAALSSSLMPVRRLFPGSARETGLMPPPKPNWAKVPLTPFDPSPSTIRKYFVGSSTFEFSCRFYLRFSAIHDPLDSKIAYM
jgi:hypothetical protein